MQNNKPYGKKQNVSQIINHTFNTFCFIQYIIKSSESNNFMNTRQKCILYHLQQNQQNTTYSIKNYFCIMIRVLLCQTESF